MSEILIEGLRILTYCDLMIVAIWIVYETVDVIKRS